jgi:8-oxo-dGTP pyrophosphatase MutT (NUDIX family)
VSSIPPPCDNTSVGVIISDGRQRFLVFDHTTGRAGVAPVSGHVDGNPSPGQAAYIEVLEEAGLAIASVRLADTGWRRNSCRRLPGPAGVGHTWWIFTASVRNPDLRPSPRETRNMRWAAKAELRVLAERTAAYARGEITDAGWAAQPGIAPVWVQWLARAGLVTVPPDDLPLIDDLSAAPMTAGQGAR